jgi:segregation and condensation protein B
MTETAQQVHAVLFLTSEPLSVSDVAEMLQVDASAVASAVSEVEQFLAGSGLTLVRTATTIQLATSSAVAPVVTEIMQMHPDELSPAAAEALAILAYRGPLNRHELEAIRGVDSQRILRQLLTRGLVTASRSLEGLPQYDISEIFLRAAGIARREELPQFDQLSSHEKVAAWLQARHSPEKLSPTES